MPPQSLVARVVKLEEEMLTLRELPAQVSELASQILQLRGEMRAEFSAIRPEIGPGDELTRSELRTEIRAGDESTRSELRAEIRAGDDLTRSELRAEIRAGDEQTRNELRAEIRAGDELTRSELRVEIRAGDELTRSELRAEMRSAARGAAGRDADPRNEDAIGRIARRSRKARANRQATAVAPVAALLFHRAFLLQPLQFHFRMIRELHRGRDRAVTGDVGDRAVHLLADAAVRGMSLRRGPQLDHVHRFARVHLHVEADAIGHDDAVRRDVGHPRGRQRFVQFR